MGAFLPLDLYSMVYFIIREIFGFPRQFPIVWENAAKSIELGEPRKLVPIFSLVFGYFSSIRFPFNGIYCYHMGNAWFFQSKSTLWALWLFFHSIIFFICSKIYWFLKTKNGKKRSGKLLFLKKQNQFQACRNSKQNISIEEVRMGEISSKIRNINIYQAKACHPTQIFPYF